MVKVICIRQLHAILSDKYIIEKHRRTNANLTLLEKQSMEGKKKDKMELLTNRLDSYWEKKSRAPQNILEGRSR